MSFVGKAIGKVVGSITGASDQAEAAEKAGQTQAAAAAAGIAEQRRQFNEIVKLMSPFVKAGTQALPGLDVYAKVGPEALSQQRALAGLGGTAAQQAAISALEKSPQFQALARQGESAILQQASATGGLRGGNVQAALAQFRPQLLQQYIDQQYSRLGGLTGIGLGTTENLAQLGQASAAQQAAQGMQSAANVSNLLQQQGAARAGGQIAAGSAQRMAFGDLLSIAGAASGAGFFKG